MTALVADVFASAPDAHRFGEFRDAPATTVFGGRVTELTPGRLHVYGAWSDPASHRLAILRELTGLQHAVSMSYVHGVRDGRGWAFREDTGPDPINGFTLLREAYLATDEAYTGPVTVPVLWDRHAGRVVSTDATTVGTDLLRAGGDDLLHPDHLYPARLADAVERAGAWSAEHLTTFLGTALYRESDARRVRESLTRLDGQLAATSHLVGGRLTDADVRLWVHLVRYDAGPNAHGAVGPHLDAYPHLWRWARELYAIEAFRATTDFAAFTAPFATVPDWS